MQKIQFEFNQKTYSIILKIIGKERCLPNKKLENRKRDYYSLHFVLYGLGVLNILETKQLLGKGNVFLLYADTEYKYYPDPADPWSYIWIDFYGDNLDELFEAWGFTKEKPYVRIGDCADIAQTLELLLEHYNSCEIQTSMMCSAYIILFFSQLIAARDKYKRMGERNLTSFKHLRDILLYINNNYRINFTLEQISEAMCISERQLIYIFSTHIHMTPLNYINKFRISNACELLKQTNMSIKSISKMVGIEDEKYFMRMFIKWKKVSATEYRKNCENDNPFDWLKEKNIDFR